MVDFVRDADPGRALSRDATSHYILLWAGRERLVDLFSAQKHTHDFVRREQDAQASLRIQGGLYEPLDVLEWKKSENKAMIHCILVLVLRFDELNCNKNGCFFK